MPTYHLPIGSIKIVNGVRYDGTRSMCLEGEKLATRTVRIQQDGSRVATETLYYTTDGRLIVHIENWFEPQDSTIYSVLEITRRDLQANGRFEALGKEGAWVWLR